MILLGVFFWYTKNRFLKLSEEVNLNAWYVITVLTVVAFFWRKDLRREMILAGLLALPVLLLKPIISSNFYQVAEDNGGLFVFIIEKIVISFSFGALAASIYEIFFHKKITPMHHPYRKYLVWLLTGPIIFIVLTLLFHQVVIIGLLISLGLNLIIVLSIRSDLIWDAIFSGFFMGLLYFLIFALSYKGFPGDIRNLWFSDINVGLTAFSIPIEELLAVFLFGAFFGPIYIALKDMKEK